jgi:hypothetical protein
MITQTPRSAIIAVLVAAAALIGSCGRPDESSSTLKTLVLIHCQEVETGLHLALEPAKGQPDGRRFVIGVGDLEDHLTVSTRMYSEFSFCAHARDASDDEISRMTSEFQRLTGQLASTSAGDPRAIDALLAEMHARFRSMNARPLRH